MAQRKSLALPAIPPDGLRRYMQEIQKFPILDKDEEYMLAKRWTEYADYDAAHKLVTSHLRLVAKIASGYRGYGLPIAELIAEGNIGLMQAVKKFEPDRGFRLSTYAMWWIRASIQEFVLRSWSLVKMGTSAAQKRLFFNLKKMKKRLKRIDDGAVLTPDEIATIAKELNVHEQDVVDMDSRMSASDQRLDAPITRDGDSGQWMDLLADTADSQETTLGEAQEYRAKKTLMDRAIASLNERERDIIVNRRLSEEQVTLEELAQRYDISRERVRQIEARALEKMTHYVMDAANKALPAPVAA
ncbi:MAG: RNA polymerase sigma factor RpoH [Alphaproteobacteria bacterium]